MFFYVVPLMVLGWIPAVQRNMPLPSSGLKSTFILYMGQGFFEPFAFAYNTIWTHYSGDCALIFQKFRRPYMDTESTKTVDDLASFQNSSPLSRKYQQNSSNNTIKRPRPARLVKTWIKEERTGTYRSHSAWPEPVCGGMISSERIRGKCGSFLFCQ
jgi:hypothetical protein